MRRLCFVVYSTSTDRRCYGIPRYTPMSEPVFDSVPGPGNIAVNVNVRLNGGSVKRKGLDQSPADGWCSSYYRSIYTFSSILYLHPSTHRDTRTTMEMDYGMYSHDHGYGDFGDDHPYAGPRYAVSVPSDLPDLKAGQ